MAESNRSNEAHRINRTALRRYAEEQPIPARFSVAPSADLLVYEIIDTSSLRSSEVPIFAYKAVRKALYELFC